MKKHISNTLEKSLTDLLKKLAPKERPSVSQIVEGAVEAYLREKGIANGTVISTKSSFLGSFSREETYSSAKT